MTTFNYHAIIYKQRSTAEQPFMLFSAKAGEIQLWATVSRLEPTNKTGVQREKKDARVDAIDAFLKSDDRNTIPTSIVVSLPTSCVKFKEFDATKADANPVSVDMTIEVETGKPVPGLIIDGQHRTFGIAQYDPATPVNVVAILGPTDDEIAFQFIVINNKGTKVSPDHIKALKLGYSDADLDSRLTRSARIRSSGRPAYLEQIDEDADSPFRGMLKWPRNEVDQKRSIAVNAFEMALMHIANQRIDQVPEGENVSADFVVRFFLELWKTVQATWPTLWTEPGSRLLKKVGVVCMTEFLVDTMVQWSMVPSTEIDLTDLNQVGKVVQQILEQQEIAFWTSEWEDSSLDTKAGRELLVKNLGTIQWNKTHKQPWNQKVSLITGSVKD